MSAISRRSLLHTSVAGAAATIVTVVAPDTASAVPPEGADPTRRALYADDLARSVRAAPPGSIVRVTGAWSRSTPLVVDKPLTLAFDPGASITMTTHTTAIEVTSSSVAVVGASITGAGGTTEGAGRGVHVHGTAAQPLEDVRVVDCVVQDVSYAAVQFEHVRDFVVAKNCVQDVGYAGVMLLSCTDGHVGGNAVRDVHQPDGYVNSYGIIVSRDDSSDLTAAPRSARVGIDGNTVTGVRRWEGIDTHSGEDVVIRDNLVRDCRVGIAVVPSKDPVDRSYRIASHGAVIARNRIERTEDLDAGSGIVVRGAGSRVGDDIDRTGAVVTGNTVVGHGGSSREAGILAYFTRALTLSDNVLRDCVRAGISLYHSNEAVTVTRTAVHGLVPSATAPVTVAVEAPAAENSAQVMATRVHPAVDGRPCSVGLVCGAGSAVTLLANDWAGASRPVGGGGAVDRFAEH